MDGSINPILCDINDFKRPSSRNAICHHFAKAPIKLKQWSSIIHFALFKPFLPKTKATCPQIRNTV
jgi:hypothetical protein